MLIDPLEISITSIEDSRHEWGKSLQVEKSNDKSLYVVELSLGDYWKDTPVCV